MKKRIWELDAFRGLCILGMVLVHFVYDLSVLYQLVDWHLPQWFHFLQQWGNVFFLLLSGICVTLGTHHVRRGLVVFAAGMLCTLVTAAAWKLDIFSREMCIWFGVLHCLGACMLLWSLFRRLPSWLLGALGLVMVLVGLYLDGVSPVDHPWLVPLGITYPDFACADYFPLLPNLGFFLWGAVLGRLVYGKKESLLPRVDQKNIFIRILLFFGKHSLVIYLVHQPLIAGLCLLLGGEL